MSLQNQHWIQAFCPLWQYFRHGLPSQGNPYSYVAQPDITHAAIYNYPSGNKLLGTSIQKALRAFWVEARPGFSVH